MDLIVEASGWAVWGDKRMRCALGRGGVRAGKREGDGATPAGGFLMRRLLYRADRLPRPSSGLTVTAILEGDGWCDDPADAAYNRPVRLPYKARAETLWRADSRYDLVVPLGYNDDPPLPGRGSAIFLHIAAADYAPTAGCVAVSRADLLDILQSAAAASRVVVKA